MRKKKSSGRIAHNITLFQGEKFDSKTEKDYYVKLLEDKHQGKIKDIKRQVKFLLQDKFCVTEDGKKYEFSKFKSQYEFDKFRKNNKNTLYRSIMYIADFVVTDINDKVAIIDTKGVSTPDFEIKRKLFIYKYPIYEFKVIAYYKKQWIDYYEAEKLKKANKKARAKNKIKKSLKTEGDK